MKRGYNGAYDMVSVSRVPVAQRQYVTRSIIARPKARRQGYRTYVPRPRSGLTRTAGFYGRYNQPGGRNEVKFLDTALSFSVDSTMEPSSTAATGMINFIDQGVGQSQRIGRMACIKSIQIRGTMTYTPAASTVGSALVTMYVILDKQSNAAGASISDIFTGSDANAALINMANSSRFTILSKKKFQFSSGAGVSAAYARQVKGWEFFHRCNIPLEFEGTGSGIGNIKSNNVFLAYGADTGADDLVVVTGNARIRFTDD